MAPGEAGLAPSGQCMAVPGAFGRAILAVRAPG